MLAAATEGLAARGDERMRDAAALAYACALDIDPDDMLGVRAQRVGRVGVLHPHSLVAEGRAGQSAGGAHTSGRSVGATGTGRAVSPMSASSTAAASMRSGRAVAPLRSISPRVR